MPKTIESASTQPTTAWTETGTHLLGIELVLAKAIFRPEGTAEEN
jgi:hypothetical protein